MACVMQLSILVLLSTANLIFTQSSEETRELRKKECNETEFMAYSKCLLPTVYNDGCKDCETACAECDCIFCMTNSCQPKCENCCAQNSCTTPQCCYKTCHATCKSTSCRNLCKTTCGENMKEDIKETETDSSDNDNLTDTTVPENLTTIINVHTVINNTNIIDLPVTTGDVNDGTNCTNTIEVSSISSIEKEPCCQVITPRQCTSTPQYPFVRCFHYRKDVCGPFCRAPIIHQEPNENCEETPNGVNCRKITVYIPQPQPNCAYQPFWPYVTCGIQPQFCGGCYSHYNLPFQPPTCPFSCYDDGYGAGPLYRQGPFYRPGFAHIPSCVQVGTCNPKSLNENASPQSPTINMFEGCGYPPITYEDDLHVIEQDSENVDSKPIKQRENSNEGQPELNEVVFRPYYAVPIIPQYRVYRYPFQPKAPYKLQPEVNIRAIITHPEKSRRYAQITIDKLAENSDKTTEPSESEALTKS